MVDATRLLAIDAVLAPDLQTSRASIGSRDGENKLRRGLPDSLVGISQGNQNLWDKNLEVRVLAL